jgi:hypothetical protein
MSYEISFSGLLFEEEEGNNNTVALTSPAVSRTHSSALVLYLNGRQTDICCFIDKPI